jgi:tetratricopeptide (TPR) repeat protein
MSEKLIEDLKKAIADGARKPLIVCGAGVSIEATGGEAPSWAGLLETGIGAVLALDPGAAAWAAYARDRLGKAKAEDWIGVADEITERLGGCGNAEFGDWIEEQVGRLAVRAPALLDAIGSLGCPVATTNYDDILARHLDVPPITWDDPDQVHRFLDGRRDGVLHLHGHWRKPATIVLGSGSYEALKDDARKEILSRYAALARPAVYVGCSADGLGDPDFTHLARFVGEWQQSAPRSYWLIRQGQVPDAKRLLATDSGRLFPLPFGKDYPELPAFLRGLAPASATLSEPAVATEFVSIEQQQPRPEIFGREAELDELERALVAGRSAVIGGGPGFGKTALAVAALYRPRMVERFGRRRLFVSVEAEREPRALLASLAGALGLPSGGEEASLLRQLQLAAEAAPLAAVIDNAEGILETDRAEAERILRLAAQIENLSLVLTTRGAPPRLPGAVAIQDLAKLDPAAARAAFLAIADAFAADPDLEPLIEALDGHALSIELVAARAGAGTSLREVRDAWKAMESAFLKRVGEKEGRLTSVRASLALSLQTKLLARAPLARRLLALLSVLPAGLARDTVPRLLGDRATVSRGRAVEAVGVLQQLRLIEKRPDNRLRMLTPLREAACLDLHMMPEDRKRLVRHFCEIAATGRKLGHEDWTSVRGEVEREAGNFDAVLRIALHHAPNTPETMDAVIGAGSYYRSTGQGSTEILESAISIYEALGQFKVISNIYYALAEINGLRGNYGPSLEGFRISLSIAKTLDDKLMIGNCYLGIAKINGQLGETEVAEDYVSRSLDHYKKAGSLYGQGHAAVGLAQLRDAMGCDDAEQAYGRALDLYRRGGYAAGQTRVLDLLDQLRCAHDIDRLEGFIHVYRNAGAADSEASARARLALILQAEDRLGEALSQADEALAIGRRIGDIDVEAMSLLVRAIVLRRQGNPDWEKELASGFALQATFNNQEPAHEGFAHLHDYILASDEPARRDARERTREAWTRRRRHDLIRNWLELPLHPPETATPA